MNKGDQRVVAFATSRLCSTNVCVQNEMVALLQHIADPGDENVIAALKVLVEVGDENCGVPATARSAIQSLIANRSDLGSEPHAKRSKCESGVV